MGKAIKTVLLLILILLISFVIMFVLSNNESPNDYDPSPTDTFTISFDSNGGVLENDVSVTNVRVGSNILNSIANLNITGTKVGYTLDGWLLNSPSGLLITNEDTMLNSDIVLYANWLEDEEAGNDGELPPLPPIAPGEFTVINDTIFLNLDTLSLITTLQFNKIILVPEEYTEDDIVEYVISLILENLTPKLVDANIINADIRGLFEFRVIDANVYIRNQYTTIYPVVA